MAIEFIVPYGRGSDKEHNIRYLEVGDIVTLQGLAPEQKPRFQVFMMSRPLAGFFTEVYYDGCNAQPFLDSYFRKRIRFVAIKVGDIAPLVDAHHSGQFQGNLNHLVLLVPLLYDNIADLKGPIVMVMQQQRLPQEYLRSPLSISPKNLLRGVKNVRIKAPTGLFRQDAAEIPLIGPGYSESSDSMNIELLGHVAQPRLGYEPGRNYDDIDEYLTYIMRASATINQKEEERIYNIAYPIVMEAVIRGSQEIDRSVGLGHLNQPPPTPGHDRMIEIDVKRLATDMTARSIEHSRAADILENAIHIEKDLRENGKELNSAEIGLLRHYCDDAASMSTEIALAHPTVNDNAFREDRARNMPKTVLPRLESTVIASMAKEITPKNIADPSTAVFVSQWALKDCLEAIIKGEQAAIESAHARLKNAPDQSQEIFSETLQSNRMIRFLREAGAIVTRRIQEKDETPLNPQDIIRDAHAAIGPQ